MALFADTDWTVFQIVMFIVIANVCAWIPVLLTLGARRENGYATVWDRVSGTRVIVKPKGTERPTVEPVAQPESPADGEHSLGPYQIIQEIVPGKWIVGMRSGAAPPGLAAAAGCDRGLLRARQRCRAARPAALAAEGGRRARPPGMSSRPLRERRFRFLAGNGKQVPWSALRHWLHDLASELWAAAGDQTLPTELSLDQVWITADGRAVLLDEPWPHESTPAEPLPVGDVAGQQRFLNAVAACVESTGLPLHARPVLQNLEGGKFEKLSFLTGTLRGLLDRPAEVGRGIRAGSVFMLTSYIWIAVFVGYYPDKPWTGSMIGSVLRTTLVVLAVVALARLLAVLFRSSIDHAIFRLAVVDARGKPAGRGRLLVRWAIVWLPLFVPILFLPVLTGGADSTAFFVSALVLLILWIGAAAYAVVHPHRGLQDRLASTWVVRR